jgi:hypothetical protein
VIECLANEIKRITDHQCKLIDLKDLLQAWSHLLLAFDTLDSDKIKLVFEAINELPAETFDADEQNMKIVAEEMAIAVHKKIFPNSALNTTDLNQEFKNYFAIGWDNFLRSILSLDQVTNNSNVAE